MNSGKIAKDLRRLNLKEAAFSRTGKDEPATWSRGSSQIDSIWTTQNINIYKACFLPLINLWSRRS